MIIKNYFKNKKKVSVISTISILFAVLIIGIVYMRFYTNAGVFKKNNSTKDYDYKRNINVLEIVAQYGQQVLGYTVSGSEPITKEQIENYHGDIDINDFKNATGYVLTKVENEDKTYDYKVKSSDLKDTFNSNVLSNCMNLSKDSGESIKVNVCQANELTDDIINEADLIYINSHDYNENLLYYYDQITNNGLNKIEKNDYGRNYNDMYQIDEIRTKVILNNICSAAGSEQFAKALGKEDFETLGFKDYKEFNFDQYIVAISTAKKDSLSGDNDDKTKELINQLLVSVNDNERNNAMNVISKSTKHSDSEYTEDEKTSLLSALQKVDLSCIAANNEEYITEIAKTTLLDDEKMIQELITKVNTDEANKAIKYLVECKTNPSTIDTNKIKNYFLKLNNNKVNENLLDKYAEALVNDEFKFSKPTEDATCLNEILSLVDKINAKQQEDVLEIIANAPKSVDQIKDVSDNAQIYFDVLSKDYGHSCKNVLKYNINTYIEALTKLSESTDNKGALLKTDTSSTTDYHYDLEKIQAFIENVNKENNNVKLDKTCDMTWSSAKTIYNHIMSDNNGFMYNTYLLTDDLKKLGDYKKDSEMNTNNLYKFLLVTRQIRDTYFVENYMSKIDNNGVYFSEGLNQDGTGIGNGVTAWWKETFGNDFTNYKKYREPDVVGKTFTEIGSEGNSVDYVYKHIYSFTGEQFMGGEKFINGKYVGSSLTGLATESVDVTDRYIFLDLSGVPIWKNENNKPYAYFSNGSKSKTVQMEVQDEENSQYRVMVPEGMKYVKFKPNRDDETNQTAKDIELGNSFSNKVYNIKLEDNGYYDWRGRWHSNKQYVAQNVSETVYSANMTNSILNGQVEYYKSLDVTFTGCGVTNARYRINDGDWVNGLKLNDKITIGKDDQIDQVTKLEVQYDTFTQYTTGGGETKVYYYKKIDDKSTVDKNYTSTKTGTNITSIQNSVTQEADINNIVKEGNKGDIIRYISGFTLNVLTDVPFKVLELEPSANVSVYNSYAGAVKLAKMLKVNISDMNENNWQNYFKITSMGVREFNTRNYDYLSDFDLIYIGNSVKNQRVDGNGRTIYKNDKSLDGYVYTGIGDYYYVDASFGGTAASDYVKTDKDNFNSWDAEHKKLYQYWLDYAFDEFTGYPDGEKDDWKLAKNEYYYFAGKKAKARMIGNDITVKKMDELLAYIRAGAPIMINDKILNCDGQSSYVDPNSKMYNFISQIKQLGQDTATKEYTGNNEFSDGGKFANIVNEKTAEMGKNPVYLYSNEKFNGGLSYAVKRNVKVEFELQSSPQQYTRDKQGKLLASGNTGTYITSKDTDYKKYSYVLKVNTNIDMNEIKNSYDFQVYVDKSGIGKFENSLTIALDPTIEFNNENHTITLSGNWPGNMEGFVPWKVVASSKINPNNYFSEVGYSAFENPVKKDVYVLYVVPEQQLHMEFDKMVEAKKTSIKDYNIIVTKVKYSEFVSHWNNVTTTDYSDESSLLKINEFDKNYKGGANDQFNMLVFGFCDSYGSLDIGNVSAIKNIEYFLNTGHSLLFSHDNSSTLSTFNYYTSKNNQIGKQTNYGMYTTTMMRKTLGMDVYGATYSGKSFDITNKNTFVESVYNARQYLSDSLSQEDYRGICEMNMFRYNSSDSNGFYTDNYNNVVNICAGGGLANTNTVMRTNEGQITDYPFIIGNSISIATTHAQYLGLNLEDKDTTVWYTLDKAKDTADNDLYYYAKGDGSNNYYIYSKGNVTYTGAGHATGSTDNEQNLFINTVIAAIKLGSLKPEVTFPGAKTNTNGKNVVYKYESDNGINASFKATDFDFKKGEYSFKDCKIYIDVNNDGVYNSTTDILLNEPNKYYISNITDEYNKITEDITPNNLANRTTYSFTITDEKLQDIAKDTRMSSVNKTIYDTPIVVEVTKASSKDPNVMITSHNSLYIEGRELFNLR